MKEVIFADYCYRCKHKDKGNTEEPCDECVSVPARPNSHKPEKYEAEK